MTGAMADEDEGAGGLRLSDDVGERVAPDPAEQLQPVLM
jgi:hypothetical protein